MPSAAAEGSWQSEAVNIPVVPDIVIGMSKVEPGGIGLSSIGSKELDGLKIAPGRLVEWKSSSR